MNQCHTLRINGSHLRTIAFLVSRSLINNVCDTLNKCHNSGKLAEFSVERVWHICTVISVNNYFLIIVNNVRTIEIYSRTMRTVLYGFNNRFLTLNVSRQVDCVKIITWRDRWQRQVRRYSGWCPWWCSRRCSRWSLWTGFTFDHWRHVANQTRSQLKWKN